MSNYKERLDSWIVAATEDWFPRQCAQPYSKMQLWFKPAKGKQDGGLYIGEQGLNTDWKRGGAELTGFMDKTMARRVVSAACGSLPILGDY